MAEQVWGIKSGKNMKSEDSIKSDIEKNLTAKVIDALENFIKEIGMLTRWKIIEIRTFYVKTMLDKQILKKIFGAFNKKEYFSISFRFLFVYDVISKDAEMVILMGH